MNREAHGYMLVFIIGLNLKRQRRSIHLNRENFRAQTECRRKLYPAIAGALACGLNGDAVPHLAILEIHTRLAHAHIANSKCRPVRGNVRYESYLMMFRVSLQSKHTAQHRTHDHCRGPNLMRRTRRKSLIIVSRKKLRKVAKRFIEAVKKI